jgi:crossover junction endodeoxyribonuclease RuvC
VKITGLDLSYTRTGVAQVYLPPHPGAGQAIAYLVAPSPKLTGHARLEWLLQEIKSHAIKSTWILIEGPAWDRHQGAFDYGGLWWHVTHWLWLQGIPYQVITPNQVKIYATGNGSAKKDVVLAATVRRYLQVEVEGNDEADALNLAALGAHYLGAPLIQNMPKTHARVLDMIKWNPQSVELRDSGSVQAAG